jgi:hypothetical protein
MSYIRTMMLSITKPNDGLRDIRPDLRERLRAAKTDRDHMSELIETLNKTVELLEQMLAQEEARYSASTKRAPQEPLPDFVVGRLRAGVQTKDSLRAAAEQAGYDVDGRSIHATLVNLMKTGRAAETGDGEYAAR